MAARRSPSQDGQSEEEELDGEDTLQFICFHKMTAVPEVREVTIKINRP